jgi:RNA polymerase sigma-70 factor (ECF subfamily)
VKLPRWLRDRRHARLLAAARGGDREAFRVLYRDLFAPVRAFLATRLARREDVEDLTSHVFHRLLERLDQFDGARGSVLAWTLAIAHHALVDHVRRSRLIEPLDAIEPASADPDPLDQLVRAEREGQVRELVARLEPALRQMFELRYRLDMSHREVAELLGISETTVKQRFSRAHRRLRAELEKKGDARHGEGSDVADPR